MTALGNQNINLVRVSDRTDLSDSTVFASSKAVHDMKEEILGFTRLPVGGIAWFWRTTAPAGFLVADGTTVTRSAYPDLADARGVPKDAVTFQLPNLIGRYVKGSLTVGEYLETGLPNIKGAFNNGGYTFRRDVSSGGAFYTSGNSSYYPAVSSGEGINLLNFDASRSSSVYRDDIDTVQPPSITLLPCIKAYDAVIDSAMLQAGKVIADIQNKLALDGSNLSSASQELTTAIAHMGMPSNRFINLSLRATQSFYTAEADGYFSVAMNNSSGGSVYCYFNAFKPSETSAGQELYSVGCGACGAWGGMTIPVKKGYVVRLDYQNVTNTKFFKFIYAEGAY